MSELKPCPFCGSPAKRRTGNWATCSNGAVCFMSAMNIDPESWNERSIPAAPEGAREGEIEARIFSAVIAMCEREIADQKKTLAKLKVPESDGWSFADGKMYAWQSVVDSLKMWAYDGGLVLPDVPAPAQEAMERVEGKVRRMKTYQDATSDHWRERGNGGLAHLHKRMGETLGEVLDFLATVRAGKEGGENE